MVCSELEKACIVLRHKDSVYLRPEEIAEAVRMMMPSNRDEAERKLMEVCEANGGLALHRGTHTQLGNEPAHCSHAHSWRRQPTC